MVYSKEDSKPSALINIIRANSEYLRRLNSSVLKIKNATVDSSTPLSTTVVNLWDLLPPINRFLLLNQTQVQSLGWSVTQNLASNTTRLQWSTLPTSVQNLLSNQFTNLNFLYLSYLDWAWVNSNADQFFNVTLYSLLSTDQVALLPTISTITNQLSLSQVVNTTALKRTNGFGELCESLKLNYEPSGLRSKRGLPNRYPSVPKTTTPKPVTPWTLIDQAFSNAYKLLRSYVKV